MKEGLLILVDIERSGVQSVDFPGVNYDSRGRVRWKNGKDMEKNMELGIQNIQAIFISRFPAFSAFLTEDNNGRFQVKEYKRTEASSFIIEKIPTRDDFVGIFGNAPVQRSRVPYFNGSYQFILEVTFSRLGISIDFAKKPIGYWTEERIREEALKFFQEHSKLTSRALREAERADLGVAISRIYPGGFPKLKTDLGIKLHQKPRGFWSEEQIEQDALRFIEIHETISRRVLFENDGEYLYSAIVRNYPRGLKALKEKLGIVKVDPGQEVIKSYGEALAAGKQITFAEFVRQTR